VDASDNLYVADTGNNRIQKFDSTGTFQWAVSVASGTTDTFINPMAVAVDGSGNVWATDYGNNRIVELSATGSPITTISGTFGGMAIYQPQGIAIDRTNNWVYVSNLFCCILRFKTDGTFLNTLGQYGSSGNGYFQTPYALAVNTAGTRLYVADPNLMKVTVLDPAGDYLESFGNYSMFGTGSPTGVAVDSSGNVYLSDIGDGEILEYGP
jgi:DNA-binding beta-propeller fold protein YncE